jgi:hypothetical protein
LDFCDLRRRFFGFPGCFGNLLTLFGSLIALAQTLIQAEALSDFPPLLRGAAHLR